VHRLFSELSLKKDTVFLDVACGVGKYSIAASQHIDQTGRIHAVDLWKEGIASLEEEVRARRIGNIEAHLADVSKRIPIQDAAVDVCLMATVLHDLIQDKTHEGTLRELKRVMKPRGTVAVVEFKKIEGPPGPPITIRISPDEVETHLRPYSFRIVKTMDLGPYNYLSLFATQSGA
jgi:ubiquinone/menaquinone biosynthesis C-methylase UbiE